MLKRCEENEVVLKSLALKDGWVNVKILTTMEKEKYNTLKGKGLSGEKQIILALDKSGSMSGAAFRSLKEGSEEIATRIFQGSEDYQYKELNAILYNNQLSTYTFSDLTQYKLQMEQELAEGMTNFVIVFNEIMNLVTRSKPKDPTVIFFTDGHDTKNRQDQISTGLEKLTKFLKEKNINSRFFTIGFSSGHDANLLSKIANTGNELGNFIYIDQSKPEYKTQIVDSISKALSMIPSSTSFKCFLKSAKCNLTEEFRMSIPEQESPTEETKTSGEESKMEILQNLNQITLEGEAIIKPLKALDDIKIFIKSKDSEQELHITQKQALEITPIEYHGKCLDLYNKIIFQYIQELQTPWRVSLQDMHSKITTLDSDLDTTMSSCFKLPSLSRKQILSHCQFLKEKTRSVIQILRTVLTKTDAKSWISNENIAKLNDLAFKAIRHKGFQKKLDERALKNQEYYEKNEKALLALKSELHMEELREQYRELAESIGNCPLAFMDVFEAMENQDCMCLCLDIVRSEAAVMDPSKVVIKSIVPTFMTCDGFLDSSIYSIGKSGMAHAGFDTGKQGKLAMGLGRESITGVMPLFLFKEHWQVAKKKMPPVLGFMCTLDIMGYQPAQFYAFPFAVLRKAISNVLKEESEINQRIFDLVFETCSTIMQNHGKFRAEIVASMNNFLEKAEERTADIIPSLNILCSQLFTIFKCSKGELTNDYGKWKKFFRFILEEAHRRTLSKKDGLTRAQIISILDKEPWALEIKTKLIRTLYQPSAILEEDPGFDKDVFYKSKIDSHVYECDNSLLAEFKKAEKHFQENCWIYEFWEIFNLNDAEDEDFEDFVCLKNKTVRFAVFLQNLLHPKNSDRREAIKDGSYIEITSEEGAFNFLFTLYKSKLELEMNSQISQSKSAEFKNSSQEIGQAFGLTSSLKSAAKYVKHSTWGSSFPMFCVRELQNHKCPQAFGKIKMLLEGEYDGEYLFFDKNRPHKWKISQKNVFRFFLRYWYLGESDHMTKEEFVQLFPQHAAHFDSWKNRVYGKEIKVIPVFH